MAACFIEMTSPCSELNTCLHQDEGETRRNPKGNPCLQKAHDYHRVFLLYLLAWVCLLCSYRRMMGVGEGLSVVVRGEHVRVGGLSLFAFGTQTVQSMQIAKQ